MLDTQDRILITGVSGSIGKSFADYLVRVGYEVFGTIRNLNGKYHSLPENNLVKLDLSDNSPINFPYKYYKVVIHCAAATSESTIDPLMSQRVNVEGTKRLLDACQAAGVSKFIYISSMSANPLNPSMYAQTKLKAEKIITQYNELDWVVLRPGLVISRDGTGIFGKMQKYIKALKIVPIIGTNQHLSTVSIDDLCLAVTIAIESPLANRKFVDVCAEEALSLRDIVKGLSKRMGKTVICFPVPYNVALVISKLSSFLNRPLITKDNVYGLKYARKPDTDSLMSILGVKPIKFEDTIKTLD